MTARPGRAHIDVTPRARADIHAALIAGAPSRRLVEALRRTSEQLARFPKPPWSAAVDLPWPRNLRTCPVDGFRSLLILYRWVGPYGQPGARPNVRAAPPHSRLPRLLVLRVVPADRGLVRLGPSTPARAATSGS